MGKIWGLIANLLGVMAMGRMTTPGATLATSRLRRRSVPSRGLCFSIRPLHNSWADLEGEILSLTPSHTIPSTIVRLGSTPSPVVPIASPTNWFHYRKSETMPISQICYIHWKKKSLSKKKVVGMWGFNDKKNHRNKKKAELRQCCCKKTTKFKKKFQTENNWIELFFRQKEQTLSNWS